MKKITKICLIISGIFAVLGFVFCIIGVSMGFGLNQLKNVVQGNTFRWGNTSRFSVNTTINGNDQNGSENYINAENWSYLGEEYPSEDVRNLDIQFEFGTLILEYSDTENIEIEAEYRSQWDSYSRSIGWKMKGNTLEIKDTLDQKILKIFQFGNSDSTLTIRIPKEKVFDEVSMEIGAAYVNANTELKAREIDITIGAGEMVNGTQQLQTLQAQEVSLEVGAGNMEFSGIYAEHLELDCGAGNMDFANVTSGNTELECGMGRVAMELTGQENNYDYEVDCGIGEISIGDSTYSGLAQSKIIKNNGEYLLDIDCGIGEVVISFE